MENNLSTKPKMRRRYSTDFCLNGYTLGEAMDLIIARIAKYGKDAEIEIYAESWSDGNSTVESRIIYKTEETKAEILSRIESETNRRRNDEIMDRQKYEYLKKKFESK